MRTPSFSDFPTDDGLVVNTHIGCEQIINGNADIANSEHAEPQRDEASCTLPIYPQPGDLPALHIER